MERKIGECSTCGGNLTIDHQCGPLYNDKKREDGMEGLRECPRCQSNYIRIVHIQLNNTFKPECNNCQLEGPYFHSEQSAIKWWNTRATDPLMDQLKAELNRLYTKIEEDRFAALADDSVPRLVFHAAIDAIANKDALLEKMAEALERVSEDGHALLSMTIGSRLAVLEVLQKYREATCNEKK